MTTETNQVCYAYFETPEHHDEQVKTLIMEFSSCDSCRWLGGRWLARFKQPAESVKKYLESIGFRKVWVVEL